MRKIFITLLALVLVFSLATTVKAVTPGSSVKAIDFNFVDIHNDNCAFDMNFSKARANTGWNMTSGEVSLIKSGSADAGTDAATGMNTNVAMGTLTDTHIGPIAVNLFTGPFANAYALDFNFVKIHNHNFGMVWNDSFAWANTGWNTITGKKAKITTGNATADTKTATTMNTNLADVSIVDTNFVGPVAANLFSPMPMMAIAKDENKIKIVNFNFGFVGNDSDALANTGHNVVKGKKADIKTGKADASTETTTVMNTNVTEAAIVDAGLIGPVAGNVNFMLVGAGEIMPFNFVLAKDENKIKVVNFNHALVLNDSFAKANTGYNTAGKKSTIKTGAAVASTATSTTVNTNYTSAAIVDTSSGPFAGNVGLGHLPFCGDDLESDCENSIGGIGPVAINIGGGIAIAEDENEIEVKNHNNAFVYNDSDAKANSGYNTTGAGSTITTGSATASTMTDNTVNTNVTDVTITDAAGIGPVAANIGGGPVSVAKATETAEVEVNNDNHAVVINDSNASANTGNNSVPVQPASTNCGGSTDGGTVTTGDASATTTTTNTVNTNVTTFSINQ